MRSVCMLGCMCVWNTFIHILCFLFVWRIQVASSVCCFFLILILIVFLICFAFLLFNTFGWGKVTKSQKTKKSVNIWSNCYFRFDVYIRRKWHLFTHTYICNKHTHTHTYEHTYRNINIVFVCIRIETNAPFSR